MSSHYTIELVVLVYATIVAYYYILLLRMKALSTSSMQRTIIRYDIVKQAKKE